MISIIIPTYNEEKTVRDQFEYFGRLDGSAEVIFVDGKSEDNTVKYAQQFGKVIVTDKNRAHQMNEGAKLARGKILLFLHADTQVEPETLDRIEKAIDERGLLGGCLTQRLDEDSIMFRWIAFTGNIRAKLCKIFYGDQGIFVRRDVFEQIGGFPFVSVGEDVAFTKRLKKEGKVDIIKEPITTSARRWRNQGILKTSLINWRIRTGLLLNNDRDELARHYEDIR